MDKKKKSQYVGAFGALLVHLCFFALLFWITFEVPEREEGGMPVLLGVSEANLGTYDPLTMTDVDILPEEVESPKDLEPEEIKEFLTQDLEETVAMDTPKEKIESQKEEKEAERMERERKEAEAAAERERKAVAERAAKKVAGAFGKGEKLSESQGTQKRAVNGKEGHENGAPDINATTGAGGYGTFSLEGRSIGNGGLPRPSYTVQEEGKVVVSIIVNPQGTVIATSIHRQTNTMNATLRKAAEQAAKRARFNTVGGVDNQSGTITYYFNLK